MKYLFVGGPKHGQMVFVRDNLPGPIIVPLMPDLKAWYDTDTPPWVTPTIKTVEYWRRDIGTDQIIYVAKTIR